MSRVVFMCGPSGAGKTTCAKRLETSGWVRLSFDVEMWRRGITEVPPPPGVRADIDAASSSTGAGARPWKAVELPEQNAHAQARRSRPELPTQGAGHADRAGPEGSGPIC